MRRASDAPSLDVQYEVEREEMVIMHNMENKQLCTLLGVCIVFVVCHTCRIIRNIEDLYLRLIMGTDILARKPCNAGCASPMILLSHGSILHYYRNYVAIMDH